MCQTTMPPAAEQFHALPAARVQADFPELVQRTVRHKGRIEILDPSGACVAVIISKAELDSLESALEFLSDAPEVRRVSASLQSLCTF
jgi:hypothetical protein